MEIITNKRKVKVMEILISIATSICVCSVFMYWYEKKLNDSLQDFLNKTENIVIEIIKDSKLHKF